MTDILDYLRHIERALDGRDGGAMANAIEEIKRLRIVVTEMRDALEQAQDCLLDQTPEDWMSEEDARDDTLERVRKALNHV